MMLYETIFPKKLAGSPLKLIRQGHLGGAVKPLTLDFGSGCDLSPMLGSGLSKESA